MCESIGNQCLVGAAVTSQLDYPGAFFCCRMDRSIAREILSLRDKIQDMWLPAEARLCIPVTSQPAIRNMAAGVYSDLPDCITSALAAAQGEPVTDPQALEEFSRSAGNIMFSSVHLEFTSAGEVDVALEVKGIPLADGDEFIMVRCELDLATLSEVAEQDMHCEQNSMPNP